ncbi:hypothetical protein [Rhodococcus sp. SMB37]|uniref:hypothetical protein n=1 Tax=Rhodococcus sp. SMB37 TaxID=2512213 RepID=UPI001043161B|nr:hypothetical protein [Rhodococcus sp. SMB37]
MNPAIPSNVNMTRCVPLGRRTVLVATTAPSRSSTALSVRYRSVAECSPTVTSPRVYDMEGPVLVVLHQLVEDPEPVILALL